MTGQDFTDGVILFLLGAIAVCIPAGIAALIRNNFVEPDPNPNVAANILLPPLIYVAGFFVAWALMIFVNWDGSKRIEHLIISPVQYVVFPSIYAALVGAATALFSIPLSRGVKLAQQHVTICWISQCAMGLFMIYAYSEYRDYISRVDAAQYPREAYAPALQQVIPPDQLRPQERTEAVPQRQKQSAAVSERPVASANRSAHPDSQPRTSTQAEVYVPRIINEPPKPVGGTPQRLPSWNEMKPRTTEELQQSESQE